mmetsp:Transcript_4729/g.15867  ORF Transcript_4729/g.15867 Transcript_4729/m.15867 type:complete len:389 (-) Transcript_4729:886-2052(-)
MVRSALGKGSQRLLPDGALAVVRGGLLGPQPVALSQQLAQERRRGRAGEPLDALAQLLQVIDDAVQLDAVGVDGPRLRLEDGAELRIETPRPWRWRHGGPTLGPTEGADGLGEPVAQRGHTGAAARGEEARLDEALKVVGHVPPGLSIAVHERRRNGINVEDLRDPFLPGSIHHSLLFVDARVGPGSREHRVEHGSQGEHVRCHELRVSPRAVDAGANLGRPVLERRQRVQGTAGLAMRRHGERSRTAFRGPGRAKVRQQRHVAALGVPCHQDSVRVEAAVVHAPLVQLDGAVHGVQHEAQQAQHGPLLAAPPLDEVVERALGVLQHELRGAPLDARGLDAHYPVATLLLCAVVEPHLHRRSLEVHALEGLDEHRAAVVAAALNASRA